MTLQKTISGARGFYHFSDFIPGCTQNPHISAYNFNLVQPPPHTRRQGSCTLLCFIANCLFMHLKCRRTTITEVGAWIPMDIGLNGNVCFTPPWDASIPSSLNSQWKMLTQWMKMELLLHLFNWVFLKSSLQVFIFN
jgi:hypothetical protein